MGLEHVGKVDPNKCIDIFGIYYSGHAWYLDGRDRGDFGDGRPNKSNLESHGIHEPFDRQKFCLIDQDCLVLYCLLENWNKHCKNFGPNQALFERRIATKHS